MNRPATKGSANKYDIIVGQNVRALRVQFGWSQEKLADALNLTFQQVQKYESGRNRIAAGRLVEIAKVWEVPIATFFAGCE